MSICKICNAAPCTCMAKWDAPSDAPKPVQHRCDCGGIFLCTMCPPEGICIGLCPLCIDQAIERSMPKDYKIPNLPQLYAERAAIAATRTGDTSRDHPPAYHVVDAQIQEAVVAMGGDVWRGRPV